MLTYKHMSRGMTLGPLKFLIVVVVFFDKFPLIANQITWLTTTSLELASVP